jgi:hypothetical protein
MLTVGLFVGKIRELAFIRLLVPELPIFSVSDGTVD